MHEKLIHFRHETFSNHTFFFYFIFSKMPLIRAFTLLQCLINANDNRIPVCQVCNTFLSVSVYRMGVPYLLVEGGLLGCKVHLYCN